MMRNQPVNGFEFVKLRHKSKPRRWSWRFHNREPIVADESTSESAFHDWGCGNILNPERSSERLTTSTTLAR